LDYSIRLDITGQFRTIPAREGTSYLVRPFTGDFDHVEGDFGRKDGDPAGSRLLEQARYPLLTKASGPFADMALCQTDLQSGMKIGLTLL